MMFEWNERFNTGVKTIDEQHQELFRIASKITDLLRDKDAFDKYDQIIVLITELKDYTKYHFKTEESYMQEIRYRKFFSHKVEHDDFVAKLNEINVYDIDENQDEYIEQILGFVSTWIVDHILQNDKAIAQ